MKAIILAAGQGTRLRPLTDDRPKCLVELAGRPLLDRQLEVLKSCGINNITIIGGWQAETIRHKTSRFYMNPIYDSSNMVETLFCAADEFDGQEDLIICYSDILYEPRIITAIMQDAHPISTTVDKNWRALWEFRMEDPLKDAETLKLDTNGFITELGRKPTSLDDIQGQYMGIVRVSKAAQHDFRNAYQHLPNTLPSGKLRQNMFMTDFLQHIIDNVQPVHAAMVAGGWLEVDTLDDLKRYDTALKDGSLAKIIDLDT